MEYILLQSLDFAQAFVRHQSAECLEAACVIVGVKDATEMAAVFIVNVIVMTFHSCILDCAIHLFDLPVCPWMVRIGEAMLDPICGADHFDPRMYLMFNDPIAWLLTKLNAVAHSDLLSLIWNPLPILSQKTLRTC